MKVVSFNVVQQLVNIPFDMNFIYAAYKHLPSSIHQTYKIANGLCKSLRAAACNFRELPDKIDISDFSIFCQNKPFGELLTKIAIKVSKEFLFLRNTEKCEMPCSCRRRH